jgi:hypothetical protein
MSSPLPIGFLRRLGVTAKDLIWLPRSRVTWGHRPLERPDGIPTLERGNEMRI